MSQADGKLFTVGKILAMLISCSIISLFICAASVMYVFGIGDCAPKDCQATVLSNDFTAYLALLSPLFVFTFGAYICTDQIFSLTENNFWRVLMILAFALFPYYLIGGLFIYAVNS